MLIPTDQLEAVKSLLAEMGVNWSKPIEPTPHQPTSKGFFRGHLVAVFQDSKDNPISEIRCLDGYSEEFEELLKTFMTPIEEDEPNDPTDMSKVR